MSSSLIIEYVLTLAGLAFRFRRSLLLCIFLKVCHNPPLFCDVIYRQTRATRPTHPTAALRASVDGVVLWRRWRLNVNRALALGAAQLVLAAVIRFIIIAISAGVRMGWVLVVAAHGWTS